MRLGILWAGMLSCHEQCRKGEIMIVGSISCELIGVGRQEVGDEVLISPEPWRGQTGCVWYLARGLDVDLLSSLGWS